MNPKLSLLGCILVLSLSAAMARASELVVHEWGTFTSVIGSDGKMLGGLELEEEGVPNFVHSFTGFAPWNKGWNRPVAGVTVRMETPVLYFYSDVPLKARVEVGFNGGSISQWYPERHDGETLPPAPSRFENGRPIGGPPVLDFAAGYRGRAVWEIDLLARGDAQAKATARRDFETKQWPRARVGDANFVRAANGEAEGFIFYRGIGRFAIPLQITSAESGEITLRNTGSASLPFVWIYERDPMGSTRSWFGQVGRSELEVARVRGTQEGGDRERFFEALVEAGLTGDEARALIATWRESYFERPGRRVFWIVPRDLTDAILPISITPRPARLERVLVGRTEVLTPEFEAKLLRDFAEDGGRRWAADRYVRAYRERVLRMGGIVGVAPALRAL